jgi:hypothetical protein
MKKSVHDQDIHTSFSAPKTVLVSPNKSVGWSGHVIRTGGDETSRENFLLETPEGKRLLSRTRCK